MQGYTYIEALFKSILSKSKAIQGRFYIAYRYGAQEINSDQLGQVVKEVVPSVKYPLSIMVPPHSHGKFVERMGEWERFRIVLFFVQTTFYDESGVKNPNAKTKTSQHTVTEDWQEMKVAAVDFIRVLNQIQRTSTPAYFRMTSNQVLTVPVSTVGQDRVSGVKIDFDFDINLGCDINDYEAGVYFIIPAATDISGELVVTGPNTYFKKILADVMNVIILSSEHRIALVRGVTVLDADNKIADVTVEIDPVTQNITITSNASLLNYKIIIY